MEKVSIRTNEGRMFELCSKCEHVVGALDELGQSGHVSQSGTEVLALALGILTKCLAAMKQRHYRHMSSEERGANLPPLSFALDCKGAATSRTKGMTK